MNRIGIIVCWCLLMGTSLMAEDLTLIRMEGRDVNLSEFLWHYHRAEGDEDQGMNAYLQHFVHYQLKVADARKKCMDTLPDFRRQCELLQARVLKECFTNHQLTETYGRMWTDELSGRRDVREWVKFDLFTYRISQHPSVQEEEHAVRIMDEWYRQLLQGGQLGAEAETWIRNRGILHDYVAEKWVPVAVLMKELTEQLNHLKPGELTKPFYTPVGISIARLKDRKPQAEWTDIREKLECYWERQGTKSPVLRIQEYKRWKEENEHLPYEVQLQLKEVYEGLLSVYWDQQFGLHETPQATPDELTRFFRSHKDRYRWEYPHYKGAVVHCLNKKAASKIKKRLKKLPLAYWEEALKRLQQENPDLQGEITCGLFQIGKNPYVDKLAFKCGSFQPKQELPYTFLLGKKLKKGPEDYTDVLEQVTEDYKKQYEKEQFSRLFAQFNVEINEDVLKTVNSCGNK